MKRKLDMDYGELAKDDEFVFKCEDLKKGLAETQEILDQLIPLKTDYDTLPLEAQIELDLYLVYALNALHWINLRLQGVDTSKNPIKDELVRIKRVIDNWNEIKDRDERPKVNIEAAKRFIKSGLYDRYQGSAKRPNHKIIFKDDD